MSEKRKTKKEFTYFDWLQSLKVGDRVKTSQCNHNRSCNCEFLTVGGLVTMFDGPAIIIQQGCSVSYYCQVTGRELGTRRGVYKNGNLAPFTEDDQKILDQKAENERNAERAVELSRELSTLLCGRATGLDYDLRQDMSLDQMVSAIKKLKGRAR